MRFIRIVFVDLYILDAGATCLDAVKPNVCKHILCLYVKFCCGCMTYKCDYCENELILGEECKPNTTNHLKCVQKIQKRFEAGECEKCGKSLEDDLSSVTHIACRQYGYTGL